MTVQKSPQTTSSPALNVSVILCTYNRCKLVLATLTSLYHQTLAYERYEVIVVDNGSSDGTFAALRAVVDRTIEQVGENTPTWQMRCFQEFHNGLAHARNKGLQVANGDIIVFLDDDTLATPTLLERLLEAYEQTGADALGARVELHWESRRPHWLSDDLCHLLGYFAPAETRIPLPDALYFSNSCFSIRAAALRSIGLSSPLLSKRLHAPTRMDSADLCRRLQQSGYLLWYEPAAVIIHCISAPRLQRSYFRGHAYWQGRAEVLAQYIEEQGFRESAPLTLPYALNIVRPELHNIIQSLLFNRPLLSLADQSSYEQLLAEMVQAYNWGRLRQIWQIIERAPTSLTTPAVLLVHAGAKSAILLKHGLWEQAVRCATSTGPIPFTWLWRHRAYLGQSIAIVQIYQPGALNITWWQRHYFRFKLWLAQRLGIRVVVVDAGGWWQHIRGLRFHIRSRFERNVFAQSDLLLTNTHHPAELYGDHWHSQHIHCLDHPGMRGYYPQFPTRAQAFATLGLPPQTGFVYLCLAYLHDEHEIQFLLEAFTETYQYVKTQTSEIPSPSTNPQLLILGRPRDKKQAIKLLKCAAIHPAMHLFLQADEKDTEPGIAAAHALVFPHRAAHNAGTLEAAMLGYSYGRVIITPDLPRFRATLPTHAALSFTPDNHKSLVQALLKARKGQYQLSEQEEQDLEVTYSWKHYARCLLALYQQLLYEGTS